MTFLIHSTIIIEFSASLFVGLVIRKKEGFKGRVRKRTVAAQLPSPSHRFNYLLLLVFLALFVVGFYYLKVRGGGERENLPPPSIQTGTAAEVTGTSALLTATLDLGGYGSVEVGFRWREAGGNWNYVDWLRVSSGGSRGYRLVGLSPGKSYEFQALLRFDGEILEGAVRSFTTPALTPSQGFNMNASLTAVYFPKMTFSASLTPEGKVLLYVVSGQDTLSPENWEWRAENENGPVTPFFPGQETLSPGSSVLLDLRSYVQAGSVGRGDKIRIKHNPSGLYYSEVPIS
jgi:hypothetical protein